MKKDNLTGFEIQNKLQRIQEKMGKLISLVILFSIGCSHTQQITNQKITREDMVVKFNQYAQNREGEIRILDGTSRKGKTLRIVSDSIQFIDKLRSAELRIPLSDIESICFTDRGSGAMQGLLIGMAAGFATGFLYYNVTFKGGYDDASEEYCRYNSDFALILGGIGAGAGLVSGTVIGSSRGSKVIYIFNKSTK